MSSTMLKYRFENVKNQIDAHDYIGGVVKLRKVGMIFKGLCPFHNEKTPSFAFYPSGYEKAGVKQEHGSFYCFGCGAGGDIFEFRKRYENLSGTIESLKRFEEELGIEVEDNEDARLDYLKDGLEKIKNSSHEQILTLSEINMLCSSICRKYLVWVKENFSESYLAETEVIEKFYSYFDFSFNEKSAIECLKLIDEVQNKIEKRRNDLLNKIQ